MATVFENIMIGSAIFGPGTTERKYVRAATTVAGTLATSFANASSVDGLTLATNDRILIKNQSTASENGIYIVQSSGAPLRAADFDTGSNVTGVVIRVTEGTRNATTGWVVINAAGSDIVGTSALTFQQFSGTGVDGNVIGPASSTTNAIAKYSNTTGAAIANSGVTVDSSNNMAGLGYLQLADTAAPGNPGAGLARIYKKTGTANLFMIADAGGAETQLNNVYGTGFESAINTTAQQTTSTTPLAHLTLTTASKPIGTYMITWFFEWSYTSTTQLFLARITVDGTSITSGGTGNISVSPSRTGGTANIPGSASSQRYSMSGFHIATFASAATHTLVINFGSSSGAATASIQNGRLAIWRVT